MVATPNISTTNVKSLVSQPDDLVWRSTHPSVILRGASGLLMDSILKTAFLSPFLWYFVP
ncbi:hypothetical protein [Prochlorothrix hollandica]|uniref:hypothetical protein n=1 Tax=Prochlorothrix hollandica TaxID=1223 RepID=UPI00034A41C8|nr:hypothetical protein [Prochlorothrix hollandica]